MVDILRTGNVKARKEYRCDFCGLPILIGEVYHTGVYKNDDIYTWRSHLSCDKLTYKLDMYDGWDDGVTSNDFFENVQEYFKVKYRDEYDDVEWEQILERVKKDLL